MSKKRKNGQVHENGDEDSRPQKKVRSYTEEDASRAKIFEDLASDDHGVRSKAVTATVELATEQRKQNEEEVSQDTDALRDAQKRIISRLSRGLCSSRKSARLGFSAALTEIVNELIVPSTSDRELQDAVSSIIRCVKSNTIQPENATRAEKRDHEQGRLCGLGSVLESGVIFRMPNMPLSLLLDEMHEIVQRVPILQEHYGQMLLQSVRYIASHKLDLHHASTIIRNVCSHGRAKTPEGLALWLEILVKLPGLKLPKNVWYHRDPLCKKELSTVAKILKRERVASNQDAVEAPTPMKTGMRQTGLHVAWSTILDAFVLRIESQSQGDDERSADAAFATFWSEAVERKWLVAFNVLPCC